MEKAVLDVPGYDVPAGPKVPFLDPWVTHFYGGLPTGISLGRTRPVCGLYEVTQGTQTEDVLHSSRCIWTIKTNYQATRTSVYLKSFKTWSTSYTTSLSRCEAWSIFSINPKNQRTLSTDGLDWIWYFPLQSYTLGVSDTRTDIDPETFPVLGPSSFEDPQRDQE